MFFKRKAKIVKEEFPHKFNIGDFVDFFHRDDVYFGTVSNVVKDNEGRVYYDIDIAGQCPETFKHISEEIVIRIHK